MEKKEKERKKRKHSSLVHVPASSPHTQRPVLQPRPKTIVTATVFKGQSASVFFFPSIFDVFIYTLCDWLVIYYEWLLSRPALCTDRQAVVEIMIVCQSAILHNHMLHIPCFNFELLIIKWKNLLLYTFYYYWNIVTCISTN